MTDLRSMIDHAVRDVRPSSDAFERATRRTRSRQRRRRAGTTVVAVVLTAAATGLLWRTFLSPPPDAARRTDGEAIVFDSQRPDDMRPMIAVMRPDGSGVEMLAPGLDPALSPDGSRVAFAATADDGTTGIYVMDVDGSNARRLTTNPGGRDEDPSWSPDGWTIVFARSRFVRTDPDPVASPSRRDLYTVAVDGGAPKELLGGPTDDFSPDWSPAGDRIAFSRIPDPSTSGPDAVPRIWTLDIGSGTRTELTDDSLVAWRPDWSPDGSRIAFDGHDSLFVVDAGGGLPMQIDLPATITTPFGPSWSPDGSRLAFVAIPEGGSDEEHDIFVANIDGSGIRQLERPGSNDGSPSWGVAPDPSVSPSASPSPSSPPASDGRDIGLAFGLCEVQTVGGLDLLGGGTSGRAWTGAPVRDDGTCPRSPGAMQYVVAVDHTGDGQADSWVDLPVGCYNGCRPHDGTDLDADGDEELVVSYFFSIMDFSFFDLRTTAEGDLRVEPILVAEPGHEPAAVEPGEALRIDAWGDAGYSSSIRCEGFPYDPIIVWSWSYAPVESDDPTEVHVTRLQLQHDGLFHVVGTYDSAVPAGEPTGLPYQGDLGPACGVRWEP